MNQDWIQQQQRSKTTERNKCNQIDRNKANAIPNRYVTFNRLEKTIYAPEWQEFVPNREQCTSIRRPIV